MAYFGLSKPWIAQYNQLNGTYSNAFKCGAAVSTSVAPNFNSASLFADNQEQENVSEFKNASVTLGVDRMPIEAAKILGHKITESGEETSSTEDSAVYAGYAFITAEMVDGAKKYRACLLPKVKFNEGEESYETKGDSITFKTPTLSGTAMGDKDGKWRIKSEHFDTEDEADEWIKGKLGANTDTGN